MIATTIACNDSAGAKFRLGSRLGETVTKRPPANAAMPPATAKADSLTNVGETVDAAAISSLSRTAMKVRPTPVARIRVASHAITASETRQR